MLEHRGRAGTEGFRPALLCLWLWLWVGLVFRAPFDPAVGPGCFPCSRVVSVGPGCLMRSWVGLLGAPVGGAVGLLGVPVGRVAWCARGRRPAREIATREPDGSEWSISKLGQAPPPPTAAAARPRLEAWPGPAGAHGRRSQAPSRSLARPLWRRPQISAHTTLVSTSCSVPSARNNSPCVACCLLVREKIRPVWLVACLCAKKFALLARKRRKTPFLGVLGELFRGSVVVWVVLGELFRGTAVERGRWESFVPGLALGAVQSSPCWGRGGASGTKFSLLGQNGPKWAILGVLGEFCTGWAAGGGVLGEFCTGDTAEATHDERLSVRSQSL